MIKRHTEPRTDHLIRWLKTFRKDLEKDNELKEMHEALRCPNKNEFHLKRRNFIWENKDKYPHSELAKVMGMKKGNLEKIILKMENERQVT